MWLLALALSGTPLWSTGADAGSCFQAEQASAILARRLGHEWPLRGAADPVSAYVRDLGRRLLKVSGESPGPSWRFDVARNLSANAFAVGDGYVVVTDGLVASAPNESHLAAVLAHEMAHVLEGHFCRRRPPKGTEFRIGTLVQHYDAQAEEDADARAVEILRRSGFSPGAMTEVLRCLRVRNPGFRAPLDRRIHALNEPGPRAAANALPPDSAGFREAQRAVRADLQGLAPELDRDAEEGACP